MGSMILCATRAQWDALRAAFIQELVLETRQTLGDANSYTIYVFYILARNIGIVALYQAANEQEAQELRGANSAILVGRVIPDL